MTDYTPPNFQVFGPRPERCAEGGHRWAFKYGRSGYGALNYSIFQCEECGKKRLERGWVDINTAGFQCAIDEQEEQRIRLRSRIAVLEHRLKRAEAAKAGGAG